MHREPATARVVSDPVVRLKADAVKVVPKQTVAALLEIEIDVDPAAANRHGDGFISMLADGHSRARLRRRLRLCAAPKRAELVALTRVRIVRALHERRSQNHPGHAGRTEDKDYGDQAFEHERPFSGDDLLCDAKLTTLYHKVTSRARVELHRIYPGRYSRSASV